MLTSELGAALGIATVRDGACPSQSDESARHSAKIERLPLFAIGLETSLQFQNMAVWLQMELSINAVVQKTIAAATATATAATTATATLPWPIAITRSSATCDTARVGVAAARVTLRIVVLTILARPGLTVSARNTAVTIEAVRPHTRTDSPCNSRWSKELRLHLSDTL